MNDLENKASEEIKKDDPTLNKQVKILFIVLAAALIIILFIFLFGGSKDHFKYNGLEFYKINDSNLTFYVTNATLPVHGRSVDYVFYFRNDPRKTGKIPFEGDMNISSKSYLSFIPESLSCEAANLVGWNIGDLMGKLGSKISAGKTARNDSNDTSKIINCSTDIYSTTIILKSNSTSNRIYVDETNPNCVILEAKDCQIIEVSERFILGILSKLRIEKI